jgi:hypothetical protein
MPPSPTETLWRDAALDAQALSRLTLRGADPVPSSFAGRAAPIALAHSPHRDRLRHNGLSVEVELRPKPRSSRATADSVAPDAWDKLAGLYRCRSGRVRVHTNFAHHRDALLRCLGLPEGTATERAAVAQALADHDAKAFEELATVAGCVVAALRSFDEWDAHPQSAAVAAQPLVAIERIGDAQPLAWPRSRPHDGPLAGLRVLDLTRILAGPFGTRLLANYGADVLLVNAPSPAQHRRHRRPEPRQALGTRRPA